MRLEQPIQAMPSAVDARGMWRWVMTTDLTPESIAKFHKDMQEAMGMSDEDYAEFREVMHRRLTTGKHVHTRFCGHDREVGND